MVLTHSAMCRLILEIGQAKRELSMARCAASVARGLRRVLLLALLSLPLMLVFAVEEAQAQTSTLSISAPAKANEGDSGTRDLVFAVSQSAGMSSTTSYVVCFTGTATIHTPNRPVFTAPYPAIPAASDYQPVTGIGSGNFTEWNKNCIDATIPANQTGPRPNNIIGIRVKGDTDGESNETVTVTLSLDGINSGITLGTSVVSHTILDVDTAPSVTVRSDWDLKPTDVQEGDRFRLLFVTSTGRNAQSTDIADYNTFVPTRAKAGHSAITDDIGDQFKVLGSTASVDARDNTGTIGTGMPIYWLDGAKVADDYADLYDGSWDSSQFRYEFWQCCRHSIFRMGWQQCRRYKARSSSWPRVNRPCRKSGVGQQSSQCRQCRQHLRVSPLRPIPVFEVPKPTTVWIRGSVTVNVCN